MSDRLQKTAQRYFDLRLENAGASVIAAVTSSPAGQTSSSIEVNLPADLTQFQLEALSAADQVALGAALWRSLFADTEVAGLWWASNAAGGLFLRLTMGDSMLAALPWELLYDPRAARFMALDAQAALIRFLPLPVAASGPPADRPLRVLFTGCSPASLPALDVERERQLLLDLLPGCGMLLAGSAQSRSLSQLAAELIDGATVWHFAGHGVEQALIFDDGHGNPVSADAFTVGTLLAGAGARMAVINACQSGAGGGAASSIAGALLRAGIPVVVAMQSAISDAAAIAFSKSLYQAIALGRSLEQATTAGRRAIFALGQAAGASWWMPALFSRNDSPLVLVERGPAGVSDPSSRQPAGATMVASHGSAISQGGLAISGQVGGNVVVFEKTSEVAERLSRLAFNGFDRPLDSDSVTSEV